MSQLNKRSAASELTGDAILIGLVAMLSAALAVFSPGNPTGMAVWDAFLKVVLAVLVVAAASKAPRWSVVFMTSLAAAFGSLTVWGLFGWLALAAAVGVGLLPRRNRVVGALAAGAALQALLHIPPLLFFGFPSLVTALSCVVVLVSGYRYATGQVRRRARRLTGVVVALASIITLIGSISLLNSRSDIDTGLAAARRGLSAARSGDTASVAAELARAEAALTSANARASSVPTRLLRLIPVAAQHQRTIEVATSVGAQVASDAAEVVLEANIAEISLSAGSVDLAALQMMAPRLRKVANSLESAIGSLDVAESPWIVSPVSSRVAELTEEVRGYVPEIELAADAAETVPGLLGVDGARTYFTIFGTPAESRELGGFLGSWALLTFDGGRLQLGESGRIRDIAGASESVIEPGTVSDWFLEMGRPKQHPQNLTSSPDFTEVAQISRQVLRGVSTDPIDGFLYLDAWTVSAMLELTGPVDIPFSDVALTSASAPAFFFGEQYRIEDAGRDEIFDTLAVVASRVVDRLSEQQLPGPEELGRVLGPMARAGRLQVVTFDEQQNDFLRTVKLLRDFGRHETVDFAGLVQTNGLANKMDLYLHRSLDYRAVVAIDGSISATATATLRSQIPADAPRVALGSGEDSGRNKVLLSLYSPLSLIGVTVDGVPADVRVASEFQMGRYLVEVFVEPTGESVVIEYQLQGSLDLDEPYSLEVWHQPLVNSDQVNVSVTGEDLDIQWSGRLVENVVLSELSD